MIFLTLQWVIKGYLNKTDTYQNKKVKKILFILHLPPPVHGVSMVGKYIKESQDINNSFETITSTSPLHIIYTKSGKQEWES